MRLSHVVALALVWGAVCVNSEASAQGSGRAAATQQGADARTPPREGAQNAPASPSAEPDLSITARVTAGELLFRKVPNPRVEFTGKPRRETVWEADRQNLPQEVQPGVTYRDIGITLRITSVFPDIDRIVAEALGEIPLSDDAPPQESPRQSSPAEPQPTPPRAADAQPPTPKTRGARQARRGRGR